MSDPKTDEAKELANRAGHQAKNATKNSARAVRAAAEPAADAVADTARAAARAVKPVAEDVADVAKVGAEATADELRENYQHVKSSMQNAAEHVAEEAHRVNPGVLGRMSSDTGIGFLALSVALYAGAIAFNKFGQALDGRKLVLASQVKTPKYKTMQPSE